MEPMVMPTKPSHNDYPDHIPVMLDEVLDSLNPEDGKVYVDGTFGAGGYSRSILNHANCHLIAIDRDPYAHKAACDMAKNYKGRLHPLHGCFGDITNLISDPVDGIVVDLGVSSMQIDTASRGFSFQSDGPLDMRMGQDGKTAADIINSYDKDSLADIFYQFGDERASRRIAYKIIEARTKTPFTTTTQLADFIYGVKGKKPKDKIHPATKCFQALRIYLNDELGELDRLLKASVSLLKTGGRLVVVSFHSLEDRRVKRFLKTYSGSNAKPSRHMPIDMAPSDPILFTIPAKNGLKASDAETERNPRSRSAHLRYAIRTSETMQATGENP
jgi:16S rRNA (cytosine1402-N4)-methyltransferase